MSNPNMTTKAGDDTTPSSPPKGKHWPRCGGCACCSCCRCSGWFLLVGLRQLCAAPDADANPGAARPDAAGDRGSRMNLRCSRWRIRPSPCRTRPPRRRPPRLRRRRFRALLWQPDSRRASPRLQGPQLPATRRRPRPIARPTGHRSDRECPRRPRIRRQISPGGYQTTVRQRGWAADGDSETEWLLARLGEPQPVNRSPASRTA